MHRPDDCPDACCQGDPRDVTDDTMDTVTGALDRLIYDYRRLARENARLKAKLAAYEVPR